MIRGWMAVAFASLALVVADVVQRFCVVPMVWLAPSRRTPILARWIKIMAWTVTRPVALLGGGVIPRPPRIVPCEPGVLILMNHQSLFDIPLVIQSVSDGYPRIITRKRYVKRYIPVISQMIGLYQYPVVDPSANRDEIRAHLDELGQMASETELPFAVFPEGTRTKNGEIGRFKMGALSRILATRPWKVYVFVVDGFWQAAKYKDFVRNAWAIRGRIEHAGTLEWTDPAADPEPFAARVREMMVARLAQMREKAAAA